MMLLRSMQGFIVKHTYNGVGKIEVESVKFLDVLFLESGQTAQFERSAFDERELKRFRLPKNSVCSSGGRQCVVMDVLSGDPEEPNVYTVVFSDDGVTSSVSEVNLTPTLQYANVSPTEKLLGQDQDSYTLFGPRERLLNAIQSQLRHGSGLRALLSSRIDMRPHQAYVAGVVLLDESRRYLLADEVGLGKTVEAGIVIQDLLIQNPNSRILVLCPGALTQQWLCEMYSKFSGQIFQMLEMMDSPADKLFSVKKLIAPFSESCFKYSENIIEQKWDLVVVDEVHHLLSSRTLYDFVHQLSEKTPSILLLSAIPAKRREDEFLRLLALLEPHRYTKEVVADKERFKSLFEGQRAIGRKIRLIRRRLTGLVDGSFTWEETVEQASDLASLEDLRHDKIVQELQQGFRSAASPKPEIIDKFVRHVSNHYRINKRILRNRRERLIENDQIRKIDRVVELAGYQSEQLEHEVNAVVSEILQAVSLNSNHQDLNEAICGVFWQSTVHPFAILELLRRVKGTKARKISDTGREFLRFGYLQGSASWHSFVSVLCQAAHALIPDSVLNNAILTAERWNSDAGSYSRRDQLFGLLRTMRHSRPKIIIFVGFPNVAELIAEELRTKFGNASTAEFLSETTREEKEDNVRSFRNNKETWLLVSDESGGEGRNFQFADQLIHFDTPWNVSRVEQRIGRLDRLGRECDEVKSTVIFDETSIEAGLVHCNATGIGVYTQSVSGLEFGLRDVESSLVAVALKDGRDGLMVLAEEILAIVESERERDDSEAVLDEASFDRIAANRFLRVCSTTESEIELENAFVEYFKLIAKGVYPIEDQEFPEGIWSFRGDQIHQIRNAHTAQFTNQTEPFEGTFRREIAQARVDLNFFTLGDSFFEAIYHSLFAEVLGRTYAIEIDSPGEKRWLGFEYVYYPSPNVDNLVANPGLQNRARQTFSFSPIHVFCDIRGDFHPAPQKLLEIRRSATLEKKDKTWRNFTGADARKLAGLFVKTSWEEMVADQSKLASEFARNECVSRVDSAVEAESRLLSRRIAAVGKSAHNPELIEELEQLQRSISDWEMRLDSIGFLSVNAGVGKKIKNG